MTELFARMEHSLRNHPPKGTQGERLDRLTAAAVSFASTIDDLCPPSRETSLAATKLEESVMWAKKAIVVGAPTL